MIWSYKNILWLIAAVTMISAFFASQIFFALHENQTIDEGVHISAGYSYLKTLDFRLNPEHPPLIKMFSALPLLFIQPNMPLSSENWMYGDQWSFAKEFLYYSGNDADTILLLSRIPIIIISLLLGFFVMRWSFRLAHWPGALFSGFWFVTSPVMLSHGHYVTTDIPVAFGFLLSAFCFRNFIVKGTRTWLGLTAFAVAISVNIKFSALLLFVLFPALYLFFYFFKRETLPHVTIKKFLVFVGAMVLTSFLLSFLLVGGNTTVMKNDNFGGTERIIETNELLQTSGGIKAFGLKTLLQAANNLPIPAYPYVNGLLKFLGHNANGHDSYFLGTYSDLGSPWYFPVAFLIKTPLAFVITLSLLFTLFVKQTIIFFKKEKHLPRTRAVFLTWLSGLSIDAVILFSIPIVYMAFSMTSHINIGVRHIAPVFPFLFIGAAYLLKASGKFKKSFNAILISLCVIGSVSVFFSLPFPLSYYSEIIGGAKNGHVYMMDSNLDWGQNLKYLKEYMDKRNIGHVCIAYFGQGNYEYENISAQGIPKNWQVDARKKINCLAVISAEILFGKDSEFSWMRSYRETTRIGGMYIYDFRK